jgi:hypothetical protein
VTVGGLPNTSTLPVGAPTGPGALLVAALLALACAAGGGLTLRRLAATNR